MRLQPASLPGRPLRAFTLVELLVVIAITGVLVAISLPVLAKVRSKTETVRAVSNLRQMNAIALLYSGDNNNRVLPAKSAPPDSQQWQVLLARYLQKTPEVNGIWHILDGFDVNKGYRRDGLSILVAPGWTKAPSYNMNRYWQTGWGMNMQPGLPSDIGQNTEEFFGRPFRMTQITAKSRRAFLFTWPEWNAYVHPRDTAKEANAAFLDNKIHVLFFDGHVEAVAQEKLIELVNVPAEFDVPN